MGSYVQLSNPLFEDVSETLNSIGRSGNFPSSSAQTITSDFLIVQDTDRQGFESHLCQ